MYKYEVDSTATQCKIFRVYRSASMPDKHIGTVTIDDTKAWAVDYEKNVSWLPVNRALVELGVMTNEEANMKELGF